MKRAYGDGQRTHLRNQECCNDLMQKRECWQVICHTPQNVLTSHDGAHVKLAIPKPKLNGQGARHVLGLGVHMVYVGAVHGDHCTTGQGVVR